MMGCEERVKSAVDRSGTIWRGRAFPFDLWFLQSTRYISHVYGLCRTSFQEHFVKLRFSFVVLAVALFGAQTAARAADLEPVGTWLTKDGRAKIRTEKCGPGGANLCGYVVWMKEPLTDKGQPRTDVNNPDPAKRSRPALGLELLDKLQIDDDHHYVGQIYNAENGKMYDVTLSSEKASELDVKGCLVRFLCQTQAWTRVADLPVPSPNKVVQIAPKKAAPHLHDKASGTAAPVAAPATTSAAPADE